MTREWIIDCKKWQKIIVITLWIGACIGLGGMTYLAIDQYGTTKNGLYIDHEVCTPDKDVPTWHDCHNDPLPDYNTEILLLLLVGSLNFVNYFAMWYVLNNKYKWLRVRCKESVV